MVSVGDFHQRSEGGPRSAAGRRKVLQQVGKIYIKIKNIIIKNKIIIITLDIMLC